MKALDWLKKMRHAPALRHADGLVLVDLDQRAIVFPSEADARFFFEAYRDIPVLTETVASLKALVDEKALWQARGRVLELEARVEALEKDKTRLETALQGEVQRRTDAVRRATILAKALRRVRSML